MKTQKKPIEENPVNNWECLASALADLPLSYPARVSPAAKNTGRNETAAATTPKTTPNSATMFAECMRTHLIDEQIHELIERLSQPRTENTG
jgi:hypothetical protein